MVPSWGSVSPQLASLDPVVDSEVGGLAVTGHFSCRQIFFGSFHFSSRSVAQEAFPSSELEKLQKLQYLNILNILNILQAILFSLICQGILVMV